MPDSLQAARHCALWLFFDRPQDAVGDVLMPAHGGVGIGGGHGKGDGHIGHILVLGGKALAKGIQPPEQLGPLRQQGHRVGVAYQYNLRVRVQRPQLRYDLRHIRSVERFQSQVETFDYETFKPYIERMMEGVRSVTAPGRVSLFARSSGTTSDRSKYIPVTMESLWWNHTLGMRDVATVFSANNPKTRVFEGKTLTLGGSCSREGRNLVGDLSALLIHETTFWSGWFRAPRTETAIIPDFDEKCAAICLSLIHI